MTKLYLHAFLILALLGLRADARELGDYKYDDTFWDAKHLVSASGPVEEAGKMGGPVVFKIKTSAKTSALTFLPDFGWMNKHELNISPGETIAVEGAVKTEDDGAKIIYAAKLVYKGKTYVLRDAAGKLKP
jgi:hypothetical protein